MLNTRQFYRGNKGFTLIELILAMAISSLILLPLISVLSLSSKSCALFEEKDELMLNANFAMDYIKYEIRSGNTIISSDKVIDLNRKYPTNIGFVIKKNGNYKYSNIYITYYTKGNSLIRIAYETTNEGYPDPHEFRGFNEICGFVESINNSKFDSENSMINLDFKLKNSCKLNLKSDIYIRCEIDY